MATNGSATGSAVRGEAQTEDATNPLSPPGEDERMGKRPIDAAGAHYRPGKGLTIASEDGDFKLATRIRAQPRLELHHDGEDMTQSFGFRRARVQFGGNLFGKHNKYKIELAFSPKDLGWDGSTIHHTPLLTWYFEFNQLRDLTLRIGQYKISYSRQRVISSGNLQLVDRSLAQGEFNLDRDIGLDLRSDDIGGLGGYLKYRAGVYLGEGRDRWDGAGDFRLHYLARFEVNPFGKFDDYSEGDFARNRRPGLSLAAAYSFIDNAHKLRGVTGSTASDGGTTDYHSFTADLMFKWMGWSLSSEFFYRKGQRDYGDAMSEDPANPGIDIAAPREDARNGIGWMVQSGYMFPRIPFEIAARYSQIKGIGDETSLGQKDEAGGGLSYYFAGHPFKLQLDYFRQWSSGDATTATDLARVQLQASF